MDEDELINLNVGGVNYLTSKQTLCSIEDTFFTSLINGQISSLKDRSGAVFIDRDPNLFAIVLNFLRTRQLVFDPKFTLKVVKHEAEFYGISPLVKRLDMYDKMTKKETCGGSLLFVGLLDSRNVNTTRVVQIIAHHNAVCVAFLYKVLCYKNTLQYGWTLVYESETIERKISQIAFCYNYSSKLMVGLAFEGYSEKKCLCSLWSISSETYQKQEIGNFVLNAQRIDRIFFIGIQLVALCFQEGKVGVYQATNGHWIVQDLTDKCNDERQRPGLVSTQSITASSAAANNFLLLGSKFGSIYLIDMQKFPLRMKDNDLLINELYEDPDHEEVTAISCYLTRTPKVNGNWIEIAYGTIGGTVRVLVQHPETVGHGPQLFQTFKVHLHPITSVMLSEKYLISVCSENHARTWMLTRFRGRISTQPGSTPHASFKILKINEDALRENEKDEENKEDSFLGDIGPFGDQEDGDHIVFIEKLRSQTDHIEVLTASNGERICSIRSADESLISAYCVHECEAVAMGNRSRRYIFTGHNNGTVQVWDCTVLVKQNVESSALHQRQLLDELF